MNCIKKIMFKKKSNFVTESLLISLNLKHNALI